MITTTTFSVTYEIPVSPERMAQIEDEMARVANSEDADSRLARLANQMLPEKRTDACLQVSPCQAGKCPHVDKALCGSRIEWRCPRPECGHCVALFDYGALSCDTECTCGATVNRVDHPMSLDLYRMRTQRNDGVEI